MIEHLLESGAVDAHLQSIIMDVDFLYCLASIKEVTIRTGCTFHTPPPLAVECLPKLSHVRREWDKVTTPWGTIDVKVGLQGNDCFNQC